MPVVLRLAGTFRVVVDGDLDGGAPGTEQVVGSPKARRLLALLASRRGQVVSPEGLVDALWGVRPPERPERNVATLVSRLRAQLGADVIAGDSRGYRLGAARVDVDEAARLVDEAGRRLEAGTPAVAASAAGRALALLGSGAALVGEPDADWVDALRDEVRSLLRTVRHRAAEAALRTGRGREAVDLATAAVGDDRFDETAHRLLMRAYREVGEPARALTTYQDAGCRAARRARRRAGAADPPGAPGDPPRGARGRHCAGVRPDRRPWRRRPGRRAGPARCGLGGGVPGVPHRAAARGRGRDGQDPAGRRGGLRRGGDRRPGAGRPLLHGGAIALPPAVRRRPHPGAGRVAARGRAGAGGRSGRGARRTAARARGRPRRPGAGKGQPGGRAAAGVRGRAARAHRPGCAAPAAAGPRRPAQHRPRERRARALRRPARRRGAAAHRGDGPGRGGRRRAAGARGGGGALRRRTPARCRGGRAGGCRGP